MVVSEYFCSPVSGSFHQPSMLIKSLIADGIEYTNFTLSSNEVLDGSVGIATGYGLERLGTESRWVARLSAPVQGIESLSRE